LSFALPPGTATFLSASVDARGDALGEDMSRLGAAVSAMVGRHGGVQNPNQAEAGSFLTSFARAPEAVACALEAQRELGAQQLPHLRMGLHTGEAQVRDEVRYSGHAAARAGHLADLGHGGQVLLSRACADLVAGHLPAGTSLVDLGSHRMADLGRPEQVHQLCHPDLRYEFPPLRSLDRYPHNLPVQLTSFVGREAAVAELGELLAPHGLVTITGSGGCGKTRLALQVAAEALGERADEAWFVDLSGLSEPGLVRSAVMAALGVGEVAHQSHTETLTTQLAERNAVIVLDNCEHLLAGAATLADALVRHCGRLVLLATSRQPLGVPGEVVWRVPGLSLPAGQGPVGAQALHASEAAQLFSDRARAVRPNFAITDDNAPAVAAICSRLDGIPLAIELAAARVRMMSVERVAEALGDRFHLLAEGAGTAVPRQATLRASVDWSYGLLPEPERAVLRRLSVFSGGFSVDAAEHVSAAVEVGIYDVLALLTALVDKSMVQVNDRGDRYRLLDTIRAYAAEELAASGEEVATADRHLSFLVQLGERAEQGMWTSAIVAWLGVLDAEHDNLRAALEWSLASGQFDTGARLLFDIGQFLHVRPLLTEGLRLCREFLARDISPARRAELYYWAASLAMFHDIAATLAYGEALVDLGWELGDDRARARGLFQVGRVQAYSDPQVGLGTLQDALAIARAMGDSVNAVDCLCRSAGLDRMLGRFGDSQRNAEEALAAAQRIGYLWGAAYALHTLSWAALCLGDLGPSAAAAAALMELAEDLDDQFLRALALWNRGMASMYRGEPSAAQDLAEACRLAERGLSNSDLGLLRCDQAILALARGQDEEGYRALQDAPSFGDTVLQPYAVARASCHLAEVAARRGDPAGAQLHLDEIRVLAVQDEPLAVRAQARVARARGDTSLAWELADEGLETARRRGAQLFVVDFLELAALLATDAERSTEAARLLAAATAEREHLGYVRFVPDQAEVDAATRKLEVALGSSGLAAATSEGRALSVDDAVAYARRGRGQRGRPRFGWASLTPTERRVAELVVDGLTNAEIAARMFVSTATVKSHLNHIFAKLGVANGRQLAAAARSLNASKPLLDHRS
jgi:predicted ATPase/DNA-binding CsgD family transcriptional regulator